jgi:hypothetical protein
MGKHRQGREVQVMSKFPEGIEKFKGSWGTAYYYRGIHIGKGSWGGKRYYDFRVGKERVIASTLVDAVQQIEKILQKEAK